MERSWRDGFLGRVRLLDRDVEDQLGLDDAAIRTVAARMLGAIIVPANAVGRAMVAARVDAIRANAHHAVRVLSPGLPL